MAGSSNQARVETVGFRTSVEQRMPLMMHYVRSLNPDEIVPFAYHVYVPGKRSGRAPGCDAMEANFEQLKQVLDDPDHESAFANRQRLRWVKYFLHHNPPKMRALPDASDHLYLEVEPDLEGDNVNEAAGTADVLDAQDMLEAAADMEELEDNHGIVVRDYSNKNMKSLRDIAQRSAQRCACAGMLVVRGKASVQYPVLKVFPDKLQPGSTVLSGRLKRVDRSDK